MGEITGSQLEAHFKVEPRSGQIWRLSRGGNWLPAGYKTWNGYRLVTYPVSHRQYKKIIVAPKAMGIGRKRLHQSFHKTAEEAYQAACNAARKLHGVFFNDGK